MATRPIIHRGRGKSGMELAPRKEKEGYLVKKARRRSLYIPKSGLWRFLSLWLIVGFYLIFGNFI